MRIQSCKQTNHKVGIFLILFLTSSVLVAQQLGKIEFKPTGSEVALPYFEKGLLLLHHFNYEAAAKEFQMAQLLDPDLVMAYWGESKCYDHAIWYSQDPEKARGVLYKLGVRRETRLERASNELERDFLNCVEELFAEEGTFIERQLNYNTALKQMYEKYRNEPEVAAFYALSLLTIAPWEEDQALVEQGLDILAFILEGNPNHPGALNYMLHGCASPQKAYKARKAVVSYPTVAVEIPYCHHLPAHIYSATGQWDAFTRANQEAWDIAEKEYKSKKRTLENRDYHSVWWLTYGLIQQGKYKKASELVKNMNLDAKYSQSIKMRYYLAMMKVVYLLETDDWESPIGEMDVPSKGFTINTKSLLFFLEGMKAVSKDDLSRAGWYMMQMQDQRTVEKNRPSGGTDFSYCQGYSSSNQFFSGSSIVMAEIIELELKATKLLLEKNAQDAIDLIEEAVALEDDLQHQSGPPLIGKPAAELYGEMLLSLNQPEKALEKFDLALTNYPNRTKSLIGKYRAFKLKGDAENATIYKNMVLKNWEGADPEVRSSLDNL